MRVENGSDVQIERLPSNEGQKTDLDVDHKEPAEKLEENVPAKTKSTNSTQDAPSNGEKASKSIPIESNTTITSNTPDIQNEP